MSERSGDPGWQERLEKRFSVGSLWKFNDEEHYVLVLGIARKYVSIIRVYDITKRYITSYHIMELTEYWTRLTDCE